MTGTQIPWGKACDMLRWEILTGCDNPPSVCGVKGTPQGCWAENEARQKSCNKCMADRESFTCEPGHPWGIGGSVTPPCPVWQAAFAPTFHPELLDAPSRTRRDRVIGGGLGGDWWSPGVDPDWRRQVSAMEHRCADMGKAHVFVHLTKNPYAIDAGLWDLPTQWMGVSCTDDRAYHLIEALDAHCGEAAHRWVSFEPVLSEVQPAEDWRDMADWLRSCRVKFVVVGGLSDGQRRIVPPSEPGGLQVEWAQTIINAACAAGCAVFCKGLYATVWRNLLNPRTGMFMQSPTELRELRDEWLALRRRVYYG